MFSPLRNRFGIPGVISVIALVFAMLGGAYAASSNDNGKATASAKAKKGPRGPKGATGPAGPAGAQGPAGPAGAAGPKGDAGSAGAAGAAGASVTPTKLNPGNAKCPEGGTEFKVGSGTPSYACNGEEGVQGPSGTNGSPWTVDGVLPPGAMETGLYSLRSETGSTDFLGYLITTISFPIPLETRIPEANVIYNNLSAAPAPPVHANCENPNHPGAASASNPEAAPGYICVYSIRADALDASELLVYDSQLAEGGTGTSGALILQRPTSPAAEKEPPEPALGEASLGLGTWAVTAPSAP